jgi:hypothetical protein
MSFEAMIAFRDRVRTQFALWRPFKDAYAKGLDALVEMGREHGYEFTAQEARRVIDQAEPDELTEYVEGGPD